MDIQTDQNASHGFQDYVQTILNEVLGFRPFVKYQLDRADRNPAERPKSGRRSCKISTGSHKNGPPIWLFLSRSPTTRSCGRLPLADLASASILTKRLKRRELSSEQKFTYIDCFGSERRRQQERSINTWSVRMYGQA